MILKQDTVVTMLFDNIEERNQYIVMYKKKGYLLIEHGSGESGYWFKVKLEQ